MAGAEKSVATIMALSFRRYHRNSGDAALYQPMAPVAIRQAALHDYFCPENQLEKHDGSRPLTKIRDSG
jgi:hypothetical protein